MNTDFRVSVDFFAHHKARKLRRRLGADAVLSLLQLWAYAAKMRADGSLAGMDAEDVELAAGWDGEAGAFTAALIDVGFIDAHDEGMDLHDWAENNPWVADEKSRKERAQRGAAARWAKQSGCSSNAQAMPQHDLSNAPLPSPSPKDINTGTPNGVLVGDAAADHADQTEREAEPDTTGADDSPTSRLPDCQMQALIAAYHDELEGHPRVEIVNAKRQKAARARWIDAAKRLRQQGKPVTRDALLEYFRRYFHHAAQSDFLTGKVHSRDRPPFLADFDFLLSPKGFAGVIEGKYHQRGLLQ